MKAEVVVIPLDRYDELLRAETRANVVVERVMHSGFISIEDILWILDTELSVELAQEMKDKAEKARAEWDARLKDVE